MANERRAEIGDLNEDSVQYSIMRCYKLCIGQRLEY